MKKHYEWSIESLDSDGEIEDVDFGETLKEIGLPSETQRLCLVMRTSNGVDNMESFWAYEICGNLPPFFEDASDYPTTHRVPKKFVSELKRAYKGKVAAKESQL